MNHDEHCAALEVEIERFATTLASADLAARVPSCPDWSVDELSAHLGYVHRWAEGLVHVLAQQRISGDDMDLDLSSTSPTWLREGGSRLVATLRDADPETPMWAWGRDRHVRFWSRRQLHETLVHRVDLEQAIGAVSSIDDEVALDAVDEFLENLEAAARFSPKVRAIRGDGETLTFRAFDRPRAWHLQLRDDGFDLVDVAATPQVELVASPVELLELLYRRRTLDDTVAEVHGDRALVAFFLGHSALE